jgi:hypothetical protein
VKLDHGIVPLVALVGGWKQQPASIAQGPVAASTAIRNPLGAAADVAHERPAAERDVTAEASAPLGVWSTRTPMPLPQQLLEAAFSDAVVPSAQNAFASMQAVLPALAQLAPYVAFWKSPK